MSRPSRKDLHMKTALMWSHRSLCKRMQVGTLITTFDLRQVLSIGYNGPAKYLPHDRCTEKEGDCKCLHAEDNAINFLDRKFRRMTMFTTVLPCEMCAQRIVNAGMTLVYFLREYRSEIGESILDKCGVSCIQLEEPSLA